MQQLPPLQISCYCFLPSHCTIAYPENTRRFTNGGLMLAHRLRRWANIKPASVQHLVL